MNFKIDPMAALTAAGILASLLGGGQMLGGGFQVGAQISQDGVRIGLDPLFYTRTNLPSPLGGMTLGTTAMVSKRIPWPFVPEYAAYEGGHIPGYGAFGVAYPLLSQAAQFVSGLDPATLTSPYTGTPQAHSRALFAPELPRQYHNFYLEFGNPPPQSLDNAIQAVLQLMKK